MKLFLKCLALSILVAGCGTKSAKKTTRLGANNPGGNSGATVIGGYGLPFSIYPNAAFVDGNGNLGTAFLGASQTVNVTAATNAITATLTGGGRWRIWCIPASGVIGAFIGGAGSISAAATPAIPISINPEIWNVGYGVAPVIGFYSTPGSTCYLTPLSAAQQ